MLEYLIANLQMNDVVLDSFIDSGSTGVACINFKHLLVLENDKYFEIAKKNRRRPSWQTNITANIWTLNDVYLRKLNLKRVEH